LLNLNAKCVAPRWKNSPTDSNAVRVRGLEMRCVNSARSVRAP